ncbi:hypothetical protein H6G76_07570 [Nostoc sp. FACHB-152]|uniref:hypothetical protein n=1 Tax=unclassified Nostoc TaxID=2593658 RepID=UPI0016893AF5|nr:MULTISPECIES: hypothetical protein [unclassified Nostoc]MBD2447024.1 hypothetical protein [Nostoc sp. FACHB-152]MBD2470307.1 hypothetical protein [Nostoc sp. FACHB-145]
MEILALAGLLLSLSPFGLVAVIITRQINKKRRLNSQDWEQKDDYLHPVHNIVEIPQIPGNIYPPQLVQNTYYYINNEVDCETKHHLDVGEQYNHSSPP